MTLQDVHRDTRHCQSVLIQGDKWVNLKPRVIEIVVKNYTNSVRIT